jgi:hypothetical protein
MNWRWWKKDGVKNNETSTQERSPLPESWYLHHDSRWVYITSFPVYIGLGRYLWTSRIDERQGKPCIYLATSLLLKNVESKKLIRQTPEQVRATHKLQGKSSKCAVCNMASGYLELFPCRSKNLNP